MSRIGRLPISIPANVKVEVDDNNKVTVTGPLGTLSREINPRIDIKQEGSEIIVGVKSTDPKLKAIYGLSRQLINNMVVGVSQGYTKKLNINGVGYKVTQNGENLTMNIGFSHPVELKAVPGIKLSCDKTQIIVTGIDKEKVGQFAANVRDIKPVEPYHAYGISYDDEVIVRKEVKSGKK